MRFLSVYLLFLLICLFSPLLAQNHDFIWLFGRSDDPPPHSDARLDFNFDPPLVTHDPRLMVFKTNCSVVSDKNGILLFYTNGKWIATFNHSTMENGTGLNPGDFASNNGENYVNTPQATVALPAPDQDQDGKYYIFHLPYNLFDEPFDFIGYALLSTTVDMGANNGLGTVTEKNQLLLSDSLWLGKLTAVQHANGRDWWVLTRGWGTVNNYYKVLLSPGVTEVVDTQWVGTPVNDGLGQAVFSPDGSKYAVVNAAGPTNVQIFDFDRCTGELSNETILHYEHWIASPGVAISTNSRFLYFSATDTLYQYDLWAADIPSSEEIVGAWDGNIDPFANTFYLAQLAPDGKIYICVPNGSNYLHVIEKPDEKGVACNFIQRGFDLMNRNGFSLPNFPNYRLGPLDGSPCDTLGLDNIPVAKYRYDQDTTDYLTVAFTDLSYYEPAEWSWDFGDNSTSQDISPVHTFSQDGSYEVCLTVSNANGEGTYCRTLQIGTVSTEEGQAAPGIEVTVFPNPCREGVNVILHNYLPRDASITLYNATGQRVMEQRLLTGWNSLPLEAVPPGMYFYEIREAGRKVKSGKLVRVE